MNTLTTALEALAANPNDDTMLAAYDAATHLGRDDIAEDLIAYGTPQHAAHVATLLLDRPCDREFGPHTHDDTTCAQILDTMNGIGVDDGSWETDALNREAEEHSLRRPSAPQQRRSHHSATDELPACPTGGGAGGAPPPPPTQPARHTDPPTQGEPP